MTTDPTPPSPYTCDVYIAADSTEEAADLMAVLRLSASLRKQHPKYSREMRAFSTLVAEWSEPDGRETAIRCADLVVALVPFGPEAAKDLTHAFANGRRVVLLERTGSGVRLARGLDEFAAATKETP